MLKRIGKYFAIYIITTILLISALACSVGLTEKQALVLSAILFFLYMAVFLISLSRRKKPVKKAVILPAAILVLICYLFFLRQDSIPASLVQFREKYPEAADFVNNYPQKKDAAQNMDVSGEVEKGKIPLFIQWDERWGYQTYGSDFFALTACGPTCLSMVICGLTGSSQWNPYEVAKFSAERGYYVSGVGTSWELMTEGAEALGLNASYGTISEEFIFENLSPSAPMICSMYPGDFTYTGHFIVLTGIDEEGNILVNDPNSRKNSEKHWDIDVLLPQIRSLWIYTYNE